MINFVKCAADEADFGSNGRSFEFIQSSVQFANRELLASLGTADHVSVSGGDGRWLRPSDYQGPPAETSSRKSLSHGEHL